MNDQTPAQRFHAPVHADQGMMGGVYANGLNVWFTPHEFTLDFVVNAQAPAQTASPAGPVINAPQKLVARVRLAPSAVFGIIRAINSSLTNYEQAFGQITQRGDDPPLYPPPDLGNTG